VRVALLVGSLLLLDPGRAAAALHRVEIGESVRGIALLHRVPLELLLRANGMQHPYHQLAYGRRLVIPIHAPGALEASHRLPRTMPRPPSPTVPLPGLLPPARTLAAAAPAARSIRWGSSLISAARRHLGAPYRWGGCSPEGHAAGGFGRVRVTSLEYPYYRQRYPGARRF
jgi:hypothetical protein